MSVKVLTPTFRKYVIIFLKYILNAILWRYISVHIILYSAIDIFFYSLCYLLPYKSIYIAQFIYINLGFYSLSSEIKSNNYADLIQVHY